MTNCKTCLYPSQRPDANLNSDGVCSLCTHHALYSLEADPPDLLEKRRSDLELALANCRGKGEYDCLVNLSGGKDSCYLLYKLKVEYGLEPLAFTTDMNVPKAAWDNIHKTIKKLDVHHITYRPPEHTYRKMFKFLLQNQEARGAVRTVCYICAPMFEGYALRTAVQKQIPLVVAGYSPGQPEPDRMVYEFSHQLIKETDWTPQIIKDSGLFDQQELDLFWNPFRFPEGTQFPRYLAPFHAWEYSQEEVMRTVVSLGLVRSRRSANPIHSNCPVNWLLMYSDLKNLGYNPYQPEFSKLIREGKASLGYWKIMLPIVNAMIRTRTFLGRNVTRSLQWLGLTPDELRITRPEGSEVNNL